MQTEFEPVQNLSSGFDEWSCAVVIINTHNTTLKNEKEKGKSEKWQWLSFFIFMANLQPSGSWIRDAWFIKLVFIKINFSSYKTWKQNSKISNTALVLKVLFLPKNTSFLHKNADISKIKGFFLLKGIFSETAYVCVLTYQISTF